MCGIVGGTDKQWDFEGAIESIKHRGPDSQMIVRDENFSLAFARLAIIDLSEKANQPMVSADGSVWIVFNGEIYGFQSLRKDLSTKGHRFRTRSDTEVLLAAYLQWGDAFVEYVDGMFAIAIYDKKCQKIKLFRDRVGIKPLYYFYNGEDFAFSSELKAIKRLCDKIDFEEDWTAIYDFLTYLYIPEPKTLYKNVYKLLPGHQLTFDLQGRVIQEIRAFWALDPEPILPFGDLQNSCEHLRALVRESVEGHLVADVPVGFFLSGGMDSSVVVAEAAGLRNDIETFSIGFDDKKHTETHFAAEVARTFRTKHHVKTLSFEKTEELFDRLKKWYDEPFADTSAFPTFLVSDFARQNVTVVLTGDGGDELFGGYKWYLNFRDLQSSPCKKNIKLGGLISNLKTKFPRRSKIYKWLDKQELFFIDDLACYAKLMGGMTDLEKREYARQWEIPDDYDSYWHFRRYYRPDLPLMTRLQYLDFHTYLPGDILTKVDRVTMAVSLEARVPLLSRKMVEFCFSVPEDIRYYGGELKGLMKEAYRDVLPPAITSRRKKGFSIPSKYLRNIKETKQEKILKSLWSYSTHS